MNCPHCGANLDGAIPVRKGRKYVFIENPLACPNCLTLNSREDIFRMQGSHLDNVRKGYRHFYSKRLSAKHPWHLMLFGDRAHGFCGIEIAGVGKNNRWDMPYRTMQNAPPKEICEKCLYLLHQIEEQEAIREES